MESALVTVIIGTGVIAMCELLTAGSMASRTSQQLTTAVHLANQIHELSIGLKFSDPLLPDRWGPRTGEKLADYDDVTDLDGLTFSPPIDARRQTMSGLSGWRQSIVVESVDPDHLSLAVPKGSTRAQRITTIVSHNGTAVWTQNWMTFDGNP